MPFKEKMRAVFDTHCDTELYRLKFDVLDYLVEHNTSWEIEKPGLHRRFDRPTGHVKPA